MIRSGSGIGRCPRKKRARRSELMPLCSASSALNVLHKTGSWSASRMLTTSKLPGCFCATALRRGQITCCEYCPPRSARNTPLLETQLSLGAWPSFSAMWTPRCRKRPPEQPSSRRGLGDLACVARADRHAAHWGSWCDALPVVRDRAPQVAQRILQALHAPEAEHSGIASRAACSNLPTCARL